MNEGKSRKALPSGRLFGIRGFAAALCVAGLAVGCAGPSPLAASVGRGSMDLGAAPSRARLSRDARAALPSLGEESTLADYLRYAALNNPGLGAAFERWRAALQKVPQARALPDPRLTYVQFIEEVETRVGPQESKLSLAQKLPWFGKRRLRGQAAWEAAEAARERYEAEKLKLFFRVRDAYYEYAYLAGAIAVVEEMKGLVQQLDQVARTRYTVGAAGHPDLIRAQVELGKLEDRLQSLSELRGPLTARLNAALNRPVQADLPWPEPIVARRVDIGQEELIARLADSNPELRALRREVAGKERGVALAGKEFYPDVTVGLTYVNTGSARVSGVSDSGKDPVAAMVSVNLPLWRGKLEAGLREAEARRRAAEQSAVERENALASELKLALYRYEDARRKVNLFRDTLLPMASQSLETNRSAFKVGKVDFLDVLDAERILLEFRLSLERAIADQAQELARLEMLTGTPLTADGMGRKDSERTDSLTKEEQPCARH